MLKPGVTSTGTGGAGGAGSNRRLGPGSTTAVTGRAAACEREAFSGAADFLPSVPMIMDRIRLLAYCECPARLNADVASLPFMFMRTRLPPGCLEKR